MCPYDIAQCGDMPGPVVKGRDVGKRVSTGGQEKIPVLYLNLFQRFQAVCGKTGTDDLYMADTVFAPLLQQLVSIGL